MKKSLRIPAIALILSLFAVMAFGCSSSITGEVKEPASVSGGGTTSGQTTGINNSAEETTAPEKKGIAIDEAVLLDEADVKITAKSLDVNGVFGPSIQLLIENNSDKSLTVQARNASVNGYMIETMMSSDVAAGKKANDELTFMGSDIETAGITTIADMEFSFHIFDSESWDTYLDTDLIGKKTSAAEGFTYEYDNSGYGVYDDNGVEIVVKGLSDDSILGPSIVVYISNTSEKNVCVQACDVSINGFMVEPIFSSEVVAGKHAIGTITFLSTELEENEITAIEEAELSFYIFDNDSWDGIADTDPITITFEN